MKPFSACKPDWRLETVRDDRIDFVAIERIEDEMIGWDGFDDCSGKECSGRSFEMAPGIDGEG